MTLKVLHMISINTDSCAGLQILVPMMTLMAMPTVILALAGTIPIHMDVGNTIQNHSFLLLFVARVEEGRVEMKK